MGIVPTILTALGVNKIVAYLIEGVVAAALVAAAAGYGVHLYYEAAAFDELSAEHTALEQKYGCDKRPSVAERELAPCLIAIALDAEKAQRDELVRERAAAAKAQADLDHANDLTWGQLLDETSMIKAAPPSDDGYAPKVLRDAWTRERKRLGVTK
ncbi:hypothetical protein BRDID11004_47540 [Bradyrhizobium diazoefficiens]|uniref:Uncharacterized protein n=1 Tax=Bradyrhizobium diazoefficiens TaxID=1355477 RepID=A0A810A4U4_9BRAD|nr:hypothetical protein [Bradyrhizobium diazoefficiens]BBZ94343.1 hypothetical protein F07S3_41760 [Bradyrhizobium diazoefficiens]BCE56431.1 hypothetical protein XF5B_39430 [Bradyrhizobium diazoefficiens]